MAPTQASSKKAAKSSIAMALKGQSKSVDIPKPRATKPSREGAKDGSADAKKDGSKGIPLPTPPHSISPSLHPTTLKGREQSTPPTPPGANGTESDIDLQDAVEHAAAQDRPGLAKDRLRVLDSAGAITPSLLATHHLPDILLAHGPLAIRHIMGYLTTSVPGFSGIPSTKARRLVVGALEGRGGSGGDALGGVQGDVVFEKVGWGKWDAHKQDQPSRHPQRQVSPLALRHAPGERSESPKTRSPAPKTMRIPHRPRHLHRTRGQSSELARSYQSPHLLPFVEETEADRMSLDDPSDASSADPIDYTADLDEEGDETDEEDWASLGAAALRVSSLPKHYRKPTKRIDYNARELRRVTHDKNLARSAPHPGLAAMETHKKAQAKAWEQLKDDNKNDLEGVNHDDAEAVRALLQLGSH